MYQPKRANLIDPTVAYISLGSNLGDREANILRATAMIGTTGIARNVHLSSLYETEPVGCGSMNDFINAVVAVTTELDPGNLLERLRELERKLGRRGGHNMPRELDLDIITMGDRLIQTERLTVPHPRYRRRAFVLVPLREIAPRFRCPETGQDIDELIGTLNDRGRIGKVSSRRGLDAVTDLRPEVVARHVY